MILRVWRTHRGIGKISAELVVVVVVVEVVVMVVEVVFRWWKRWWCWLTRRPSVRCALG